MASIIDYITQGSRIFLSSIKRRLYLKKYDGNAKSICQQTVKDCFNGRYFQTSTGNFTQFWTRDFGWCTKSLLELKYEKEVHQTLRYALNRFSAHNKITTTLTPKGKPFDFPKPAVDSLPWLIHAIKVSKFPYHAFKPFLNKQIQLFFKQFIDPHTGLVKPDLHVSSMKDFAVRKSSCYDNCMVALLARDLKGMKLHNPFTKYSYPDLIVRHFYNGTYFHDDLTKQHYIASDANIFPLIFGIVQEDKIKQSVVQQLEVNGLCDPIPAKYTAERRFINFIPEEIFLRNYESDAIWPHMGLLYVKWLKAFDENLARKYTKKYAAIIEKHNNFMEVFTKDVKPYSSPFYYCDTGMLWAANFATL